MTKSFFKLVTQWKFKVTQTPNKKTTPFETVIVFQNVLGKKKDYNILKTTGKEI